MSVVWRVSHILSLSLSFITFPYLMCTSHKMRAFLKTLPAHACRLYVQMDLYYFTKKHQRRNLFCSTKDMISSPLYRLNSAFFWLLPGKRMEEKGGIHNTQPVLTKIKKGKHNSGLSSSGIKLITEMHMWPHIHIGMAVPRDAWGSPSVPQLIPFRLCPHLSFFLLPHVSFQQGLRWQESDQLGFQVKLCPYMGILMSPNSQDCGE